MLLRRSPNITIIDVAVFNHSSIEKGELHVMKHAEVREPQRTRDTHSHGTARHDDRAHVIDAVAVATVSHTPVEEEPSRTHHHKTMERKSTFG